jgi:flagellar biosynthesis protein FlhF
MRVKRYVADSIQEAVAKVKQDLGRNAIILHTKQFKEGGFFGLFSQRRFEVIAAIDENNVKEAHSKTIDQRTDSSDNSFITKGVANGQKPFIDQSFARKETAVQVEPALQSIKAEITTLKELILKNSTGQGEPGPGNPATINAIKKQLAALDLDEALINELISKIPPHLLSQSEVSEKMILALCSQHLINNIKFDPAIHSEHSQSQQIIALVGPTGVGKTTTIAKLAANYSIYFGKKVGLITVDTFRIAAVNHLKTYGEIINLPVEVVYAPEELDSALRNLSQCDLVLLDTAGSSPYNRKMMDDLRRFLAYPGIDFKMLVISATTRYRDMENIIDNFGATSFTHLIFTKLDETAAIGPVLSLAWKCKLPLSFITTGQNVPEDIEQANPSRLVSLLYKGSVHG